MKGISATLLALGISMATVYAQDDKNKVYPSGYARGTFYSQDINVESAMPDTITPRKLNSGHVLTDVAINLRPNDVTEILGMVRIRNDFGGFFGRGFF
jgi:hypothetical protein